MSNKYRIHPRGFMGIDTGKAQTVRTKNPFSDIISMRSYRIGNLTTSGDNIPYNPLIHSLYSKSIVDPKCNKDIDFQEDVYKAAIEVFGGKANGKILDWFRVQYDNRLAGDMHSRYLCDIVKYTLGMERSLSNHSWKTILGITDEGDDIGAIPSFISDNISPDLKVTDFLCTWLTKKDGFNDLLCNLQIMFGDVNV